MKKIMLGIATVALTFAMSLGVSAQTSLRDGRAAGKAYPTVELATLQSMPALGTQKVVPNRTPRTHKLGGIATKTVSLTMSVSNIQDHQADVDFSFASGVEVIYGTMPASTFNNWVAQYSAGDTAAEVYDDLIGEYAQNLGIATTSGTVTLSDFQVASEYAVLALACGNGDTTAYWQFFTTTGDMPTVELSNVTPNGTNLNFTATLTNATGYTLFFIDVDMFNYYYEEYYMWIAYGYISVGQLLSWSIDTTFTGTASGNESFGGLRVLAPYWIFGNAYNATDTSNSSQLIDDEVMLTPTDGGTGDATVDATYAGAGTTWVAMNLAFNDQACYYRAGYVDIDTWNGWVTDHDYTIDSLVLMADNMTARTLTTADTMYGLTANTDYIFVFAAYNQNHERANLTTAPFAWDTIMASTADKVNVTVSNFTLTDTVASFHAEPVNGCNYYEIKVVDTMWFEYIDRNYTLDQNGNRLSDYLANGYTLSDMMPSFDGFFSGNGLYAYDQEQYGAMDITLPLPNGAIYVMFISAYQLDADYVNSLDSNMYVQQANFQTPWTAGGTGLATLTLGSITDASGHSYTASFNGNSEYAFCHYTYMSQADFESYYNADTAAVEEELLERTGYYNYQLSGNVAISNSMAPETHYLAFAIPYNKNWEAGAMVVDTFSTYGLMPHVEVELTATNCHDIVLTTTPNEVVESYKVVFISEEQYEQYIQNYEANYDFAWLVSYFGLDSLNASTEVVNVQTPGASHTISFMGNDGDGINYGQSYFICIFANDGSYANNYLVENDELNPYIHEQCEGIDDVENAAISVYPNPATSVVNVKAEGISHIEFYNALGQQVRSERVDADEATLDLSTMARGIYMMKVYSGSEATTTKLVVE